MTKSDFWQNFPSYGKDFFVFTQRIRLDLDIDQTFILFFFKMKQFLTSESVTSGHPDKICDQISDAILDACLAQDKNARVACEVLISGKHLVIAGEITTTALVDYKAIAKQVITQIWYDSRDSGFNPDEAEIECIIQTQSPDIAIGVDSWGAGDQGIMFGYATNETSSFLPMSIDLAHKLAHQLETVRKNWIIPQLGPDGKTQVTICIEDGQISHIDTIVISSQHSAEISLAELQKQIKKEVIDPICWELITEQTKIYINPTGIFLIWWPSGDTGLTGRKIIVDTYGGMSRHGGGAFSGKDPTKVDRSWAYIARYLAKNIVASGLCEKCEIQISYAIGIAQPISIFIEDFGSAKCDLSQLSETILKHFDLSPQGIINFLNLKRPIYQQTACYGHFGKENLPREKLESIKLFKSLQ